MSYFVKEMFYTLQGEGSWAGRPAVFCRFSGCNLWTGHERHRPIAICQFCDTDFVGTDGTGGGKFSDAVDLSHAVADKWGEEVFHPDARPYVVCTGGEPLLQLDAPAVDAMHDQYFEVAIETNGTLQAPSNVDFICVSPKAGTTLVQNWGDDLKLVFPQDEAMPEDFEHLRFKRRLLQPMDGPDVLRNTELAIKYCLAHPQWHLSIQTHKYIGVR